MLKRPWLGAGRALRSALLALVVFGGSAVVGEEGRVRLNTDPDSVFRPHKPEAYGLAALGKDVYVAWVCRQAFASQVFLSRVDLDSLSIEETIQLSEGKGASSKGGRMFPDAVAYQGDVYVSWLDRGQKSRRGWHSINILSLAEHRAGKKPHLFEFGKYMGDPRLMATSRGLFLLGFSQNLGDNDWRIRLFKRTAEGWIVVDELNQDLYKGRDPLLAEDSAGLSLYWVWGKRVLRARSTDGEHWSPPEAVVEGQGRIDFLQLAAKGERVDLAWAELQVDVAEIRLSRFDGSAWSQPETVAQLKGKGATLSLALDKKTDTRVIAYSYNRLEGQGRVIGYASEREGWVPHPLTKEEPEFIGSRFPLLFDGADGLYLAWSFFPKMTQMPKAESLFVAVLNGAAGEIRPEPIGRRQLKSVDTAPRLLQFDGKLYVSYHSSRVVPAGNLLSKGDLYLEKVELLREARGGKAE